MYFAGGWCERFNKQNTDEDCVEMDEGAAETQANMQPCGSQQAVFIHHLVQQTTHCNPAKIWWGQVFPTQGNLRCTM